MSGETGHWLRAARSWRLVAAAPDLSTATFRRPLYDAARVLRSEATVAVLHFAGIRMALPARRALLACIRLDKIAPDQAQALLDAYARHVDPVGADSLHDFLAGLGADVLEAFRDPLNGVLTAPLHRGLFGADADFVAGLDRLAALDCATGSDALNDYVDLYLESRRSLVALALALARRMPSFGPEVRAIDEDFFQWWRRRWTRSLSVVLPAGRALGPLPVPETVPDDVLGGIRRVLLDMAGRHARLADRLDGPEDATAAFASLFLAELFDGTAGLLLNRLAGERCPRAEIMTTRPEPAGECPTRWARIKAVELDGERLHDVFGRFFAVRERALTLPTSGVRITVRELGGCPFPDHGYSPTEASPP